VLEKKDVATLESDYQQVQSPSVYGSWTSIGGGGDGSGSLIHFSNRVMPIGLVLKGAGRAVVGGVVVVRDSNGSELERTEGQGKQRKYEREWQHFDSECRGEELLRKKRGEQ
jgi:hypothetical protein